MFSAPEFEQEERGHEAQFPKDEPVKKIQRSERAEQSGLEEEHQRIVKLVLLLVRRGDDREGNHDGGQREHEQAETVDPEKVIDAERRNPPKLLHELQRTGGAVEVAPQPRDQRERNETEDDGELACQACVNLTEPAAKT